MAKNDAYQDAGGPVLLLEKKNAPPMDMEQYVAKLTDREVLILDALLSSLEQKRQLGQTHPA